MGAEIRSHEAVLGDVALPDRYRIVRRIARGGMASVWCAHDTTLGRAVAIKLLGEQFVHDDAAVRRFKREARAAARLSGHPHVITIFDVGQADVAGTALPGRPFIVMEHLTGGTVADAIKAGEITRATALLWLREAASALDFAHGRGVVHRDIKPGNLLLDDQRRLHVADFGIARVGTEDTITRAGELFGTAAYLSPEQALGKPATEASDRYALATVAYELLVGERPFSADNFTAQARQHVEDPPPRASHRNHALPRALDPVLARGLAKRPEERWDSATAFVDALDGALGDEAPTVARARPVFVAGRPRTPRRTAPPPRPTPPSRSTRPRAIALAALAAGAFGIGATAGASTDSPHRTAAKTASRSAVSAARATHRTNPQAPKAKPKTAPPPAQATTTTQTTTTPTAATGTPAAAPAPPPTADVLEARGHQLMLGGNYQAAIAVLRQALAGAAPSSLTYAYALFDLGRSLRLAGDPRDAAIVLQRRLQIPNQTDVVRHQLELALRAIGAQLGGKPGHGPGDGRGHGHDHH